MKNFSVYNAISEVLDLEVTSNGYGRPRMHLHKNLIYNIEIWFDGDTIERFVFRKLRSSPANQSIV